MESWPAVAVPRLADLGLGNGSLPRVYDSATRTQVEIGAHSDPVLMYVCGITPYDATHLGHAATYLLFDTLQRACRDAGRGVRYVQNVTDVDDPLLERAAATGQDWVGLAARETQLFREDMASLRILPPDEYIGAVEAIPSIVNIIDRLRDSGAAYDVDGDLYFAVSSAEHLGEVAHLPVAEMIRLSAERGGDPQRPGKKDPLDCLLWQAARPGEPSWDSPFGPGRPGWHIECGAIALEHLGPVIDVQGGGSDLLFPHHELGAAECAVVTGEWPFAHTFVHQAMVGYDGEKMSKSRGNLVLVSALRREGADPMAIRLALLAHHYRTDWEWHSDELVQARDRLSRWRAAFNRATAPAADAVVAGIRATLADDLGTAAALRVVDEWSDMSGDDGTSPAIVTAAVDALLGIV